MARYTYTKTVENYTFNPPNYISEEEYNQLKRQIRRNPSAALIDENSVQNSHDKLKTVLIFGIIALIIGLIGMFAFEEPQWWGGILLIISVFGVLHPLVNKGDLESSKNRLAAEQHRINYFRNLKKMVENNNDYRSFKIDYQRTYGNSRSLFL